MALASENAPPSAGRPADPGAQGRAIAEGKAPPQGYQMTDKRFFNNPAVLPPLDDVGLPDGALSKTTAHNCYPSGTAGYESHCVEPGHIRTTSAYGTFGQPFLQYHWTDKNPFAGQHDLNIYIVDEMPGTRAREWLQWFVSDWNTNWGGPSGRPWRPTFHYYTGEYLRSVGYSEMSHCASNRERFVEFCTKTDVSNGATSVSYMYEYLDYNLPAQDGHAYRSDAFIGAWQDCCGANDQYVGYSVGHEFGHAAIGLAHNTDCDSIMTYCGGVIGINYLFFNVYDRVVAAQKYDAHFHD